MAKQRHLDNAPIVEAIIDFRVRLAPAFDLAGFSSLKQTLHTEYPKMEDRREFAAGIQLANKQVHQVFEDKGLVVYLFRSEDG
jgi:uncharacterized protein (TIGR04255 family)